MKRKFTCKNDFRNGAKTATTTTAAAASFCRQNRCEEFFGKKNFIIYVLDFAKELVMTEIRKEVSRIFTLDDVAVTCTYADEVCHLENLHLLKVVELYK